MNAIYDTLLSPLQEEEEEGEEISELEAMCGADEDEEPEEY